MSRLSTVFCVTALIASLGSGGYLRAELILDDFNDPGQVTSPALLNAFLETPHIGELDALRQLRIFGLLAAPNAVLAASPSGSALIATADELNPQSTSSSVFASVQFQYRFAKPNDLDFTVDVTEGGRSNAIMLDFRRLTMAAPIPFFRLLVRDAFNTFESSIVPVPQLDSPFTTVFMFDGFQPRGGGVGLPDFRFVKDMDFTIRLVGGSGPPDLDFRMELDRIRIGKVPEPSGRVLLLMMCALLATVCRR